MPKLDLSGNTVNVRDVGSGPPVILLHASSSHSGQWKELSDQIRHEFRVLAPDFHGYGKSDPLPADDRPYFRHDTAIVNMLMGTLAAPVHLVGHSLGGAVAVRAALEHPDRVASLTLIEPVLFNLLDERDEPTYTEYLHVAHAVTVLLHFGDRERAAHLFFDYWGAPGGLDGVDGNTRDYVIRTIDRVADDWFGISGYAPGALTTADLQAVTSPTLLLCGEKTRSSMHRMSAILRRALPEVEYQEIQGAGHLSPITHAARVNEIVVGFLKRRTANT